GIRHGGIRTSARLVGASESDLRRKGARHRTRAGRLRVLTIPPGHHLPYPLFDRLHRLGVLRADVVEPLFKHGASLPRSRRTAPRRSAASPPRSARRTGRRHRAPPPPDPRRPPARVRAWRPVRMRARPRTASPHGVRGSSPPPPPPRAEPS